MTIRGIITVAHGLTYYSRLQEVTANNLANVSTDGFKVDRMTGVIAPGTAYPVPVEQTDLAQGGLRSTGRELDIALEGRGFLVVRTRNGERFTRGGSLRLDPSGQLVDGEGNAVLGTKGPIVLPGGKIEIQADGAVLMDGTQVDQLRLENVSDPLKLRKEGAGRFFAEEKGTPITEGLSVRQGFIEEPNSDAVSGMIDLVTIQRAYAANVDALKAMDGVLGTIAGEVGRVS
ncbi:MAG TPA: flagellar hook basal-body protein [Gemmatimonadales bacterium]|nr:flagellar hook basal-body protein [Gemmatimonadales bacterium]